MRISAFTMAFFVVALSPPAEAQLIGCTPQTCTDSLYGLGRDTDNSILLVRTGVGGACGFRGEIPFTVAGQVVVREQNSCDVSATNRCMLELPTDVGAALESGFFQVNKTVATLAPGLVLGVASGTFRTFAGSVGHRQLHGRCVNDGNEECGLDADCGSGTGCMSTCFSTGADCASNDDCAADDCVTEIEWDDVGTCPDGTTICSADADCGGETCSDGLLYVFNGCQCCQSSTGTFCGVFGVNDNAELTCPPAQAIRIRRGAPDWVFEGGADTNFEHEAITAPLQQEGVCSGNRSRPCGALGDIWAGSLNDKCAVSAPCPDPFDPTGGASPSECDDTAFGGIVGDTCDFTENGFRSTDGDVSLDGSPNPNRCGGNLIRLIGQPNVGCSVQFDIPDGDPQAGCSLINFGIVDLPDLDCSLVDDRNPAEGRCHPDGATTCAVDGDCASGICVNDGNTCPFVAQASPFQDSNNDDIGDECQCGDATGDGAISGLDIAACALCANGVLSPACDATILDADGDFATTANDIAGIVSVVNGVVTTSALECARNVDTTTP